MIVFDAEPLVALYADEEGSDAVVERLRDVEGGGGFINIITCTEIHYVVSRDDHLAADEFISRVRNWLHVVPARAVWEEASFFKATYPISLGDAFTLATARKRDAIALVGDDRDFGGVDDVEIERFRST